VLAHGLKSSARASDPTCVRVCWLSGPHEKCAEFIPFGAVPASTHAVSTETAVPVAIGSRAPPSRRPSRLRPSPVAGATTAR